MKSEVSAGVPVELRRAAAPMTRRRRRPGKPSTLWRIREEIPIGLRVLLVALSLATPLAIWTYMRATNQVSDIFLPSPIDVAQAGREMISSGQLSSDTWASVQRVGIGFGLAVLISIPLGLGIGTFRSVQALFEPAIGVIRYLPATAFVPLLLIWLGIGEAPKIALILIGTVFFNTLMTANVVWQVPTELIRVSQTLGASSLTVFRKVIFPHAVPGMIDSVRVNLAAAWNLIVVAELIAADQGLGYRIVRSQKFLHIDQIFVVLVVIGLLGVGADILLRTARNRLAPWSQEQ